MRYQPRLGARLQNKIKENRKNKRLENYILHSNDYYFGVDVSISRLRRGYGSMGIILPFM